MLDNQSTYLGAEYMNVIVSALVYGEIWGDELKEFLEAAIELVEGFKRQEATYSVYFIRLTYLWARAVGLKTQKAYPYYQEA